MGEGRPTDRLSESDRALFDRIKTWHLAVGLCEQLMPGHWSTWDCPECGQPSPAGNPDGDPQVFVVCGYCGADWIVDAPGWMLV